MNNREYIEIMDPENQENWTNDELIYEATLIKARTVRTNNKIQLICDYSGIKGRTINFSNEAKLSAFLKNQTTVDIWEIVDDKGQTRYWYKDRYNKMQKVADMETLDRSYVNDLPSYYYGYVIKEISQGGKITDYILKQYNWYWVVNGVKRYDNHNLHEFARDFNQLKKSWDNTRISLGVGFGALAISGAYWASKSTINSNASLDHAASSNEASAVSLMGSGPIVKNPIEDQYVETGKEFKLIINSNDIFDRTPEQSPLNFSINSSENLKLFPWLDIYDVGLSIKQLASLHTLERAPVAFSASEYSVYFNARVDHKQSFTNATYSLYKFDMVPSNTNDGYVFPPGYQEYPNYGSNDVLAFKEKIYLISQNETCVDILFKEEFGKMYKTIRKPPCLEKNNTIKKYRKLTASEFNLYILSDNDYFRENSLKIWLVILDLNDLNNIQKSAILIRSNVAIDHDDYSVNMIYSNSLIYLAIENIGLQIVDVSVPKKSELLDHKYIPLIQGLAVKDNRIYLSGGNDTHHRDLYIFNAQNPKKLDMIKIVPRFNNEIETLFVSNNIFIAINTNTVAENFLIVGFVDIRNIDDDDDDNHISGYEYAIHAENPLFSVRGGVLYCSLGKDHPELRALYFGARSYTISGIPPSSITIPMLINANDGEGGITTLKFNIHVTKFPNLLWFLSKYYKQLIGSTLALSAALTVGRLGYRYQKNLKRQRDEAEEHLLSMPAYSLAYIPEDELSMNQLLGSGAYGKVYEGVLKPNTPVAIKQLPNVKVTTTLIKSITSEVEIMSALNNVCITRIYGISIDKDKTLCLVMELMNKGSLTNYLKQHTLTELQRADIALQIAIGLRYLHSQKKAIVHGDIKSQNILLHEEKNQVFAKLTDFGLSTVKPKKAGQSGTYAWMAPELLDGKGIPTLKTDVYSFGMLLWEIVTQKIPFENETNPAVIKNWVIRGVREVIPDNCPEMLAKLINECWHANPAERPTIAEVVTRLKAYKTLLEEPRTPTPLVELGMFSASGIGVIPGFALSGLPPSKSLSLSSPHPQ